MRAVMEVAHEDKFTSMARQMGKWVDQVLGQGFQKYCPEDSWSPALNLYEDETHYCVVVDLAGVEAGKIDLRAESRVLVLSGLRKTPGMAASRGRLRVHHMEIDHGHFCRSLELPENVDTGEIKASYKSGMLWIYLPKKGV